jgi:MFS transporter, DHA2 family, methylenomycin A resistance protein
MRSRSLVLVTMCVGYFLVLLDVTIVNVTLPRIGTELHAGVSGLQWVVDAYAVVLASLMLSGGTVGDRYGHKRVVLTGLALFGLGSLGCGLAAGPGLLIAARAAQGAGAAFLLPGTLAIIARTFPQPAEQARAIGIWAGVGGVALPAGPVLGGALVDGPGWRWVFLINIPVVLAAGLVAARVVDESTEPGDRPLDLAGMALGALLLGTVTFAFVAGSALAGVLAGVLAAALLAALLAVERRRPDPMLPLGLFGRPGFSAANAVAGAMNLGTLGLLFVLTLYLQRVQDRSALAAGLALLPLFAPLSVLAPVAGRLTARTGPRAPMAAGLLVAATGVALLALLHPHSAYLALVPSLLLWGIGLGVLTPAVVAAAMRAVPAERAGLASATNNTARQAGGAIGIAAYGSLAGDPAHQRFVTGLHGGAVITAGLFLVAAVTTLGTIRD